MKLTGWYRPEQKPVRVGAYELKSWSFKYAEWNGKEWGFMCCGEWRNLGWQRQEWRGIAK